MLARNERQNAIGVGHQLANAFKRRRHNRRHQDQKQQQCQHLCQEQEAIQLDQREDDRLADLQQPRAQSHESVLVVAPQDAKLLQESTQPQVDQEARHVHFKA